MNDHPVPAHPGKPLRRSIVLVALLFFMTMGYGTVTTPLWPLYQERDGFGPTMVTVIFSMYTLGTVLTLLFAGSLSDRFGRTRVLALAAAIGVLSIAVFLLWDAVPGLMLARTIQGVGVGLTASTATAAIVELAHAGAARNPRSTATALSTVANLGGLGAGALIGGLISEWFPAPLAGPFLFYGATLSLAAVSMMFVQDTTPTAPPPAAPSPAKPAKRRRLEVPAGHARRYFGASALGLTAFATFGMFTSLVPVILVGDLQVRSRILAGAMVLLVMGVAALSQLLVANRSPQALSVAGVVLYPLGWALTAIAVGTSSLAMFVLAALVGGASAGLLFSAGSATVDSVADADQRAGAHAGFFLLAYLGMAVPVIGLAALSVVTGNLWAVLVFGALLSITAVAGSTQVRASRDR
ncbi:MFS transporter [Tomitella biformata]|uniref:MFS transporter n=1 Tax=Tomitella biformata TaxID=630403 RepID=UPI000686B7EF|nr:MFS transporter [Tomitella biformata]